jgi:predicted small metal-binding protein
MLECKCRDLGFDCGAVFVGENDEEVQKQAHQHGIAEHSLEESDFSPALVRKIKSSTHSSQGT